MLESVPEILAFHVIIIMPENAVFHVIIIMPENAAFHARKLYQKFLLLML